MTDIDSDDLRERMQDVIQECEGDASGELVVSYVLVVRTTVKDDADASGYRYVYSNSPVSERMGLLRYATLLTERQVVSMGDG